MSLLDTLIERSFGQSPKTKEAAAEGGKLKEAASSMQMNKLADSLDYLADVLVKGAQEGDVDDAGIDVGQAGTDVIGGDFADRWVTDVSGGPLSAMSLGSTGYGMPGQVGQSPDDNLATRGVGNLGGTAAPITNQFDTPGMGGPVPGIETLASLRKNARDRASAAMGRVLGRVKAAAMRRTAAEDPAIAPVLGGDSLTGDPPTFAPIKDPLAAVPQDPSKLIDLTNTEGDKARADDAKGILGGEAVSASNQSLGEAGEILEHESGDEIPTVKAAHAAILRGAVLSSIANGG